MRRLAGRRGRPAPVCVRGPRRPIFPTHDHSNRFRFPARRPAEERFPLLLPDAARAARRHARPGRPRVPACARGRHDCRYGARRTRSPGRVADRPARRGRAARRRRRAVAGARGRDADADRFARARAARLDRADARAAAHAAGRRPRIDPQGRRDADGGDGIRPAHVPRRAVGARRVAADARRTRPLHVSRGRLRGRVLDRHDGHAHAGRARLEPAGHVREGHPFRQGAADDQHPARLREGPAHRPVLPARRRARCARGRRRRPDGARRVGARAPCSSTCCA